MISSGLTTSYAPPFALVRNHFIVSIVAYFLLTLALVIVAPWMQGHYFQPHLLGLTHLATLGWISMIMMGALYQLVPVVLETKLWSARLAQFTFWLFLPGATGMIVHLWDYRTGPGLWGFGLLTLVAFALFVTNLLATLAQVEKWNITGIHILAALVTIILAAALGVALAYNLWKTYLPGDHLHYLRAHAHLAFLGWVLLVVMGVAYKLIPMFALAHGYSMTAGKWAFGLVSFATVGLMTAWSFSLFAGHAANSNRLEIFYALLLATGIAAFLWQMWLVYRHRRRKQADVSMHHTVLSFIFLGLATALGVTQFFLPVRWPQAVREGCILLYGWLAVIGFAGFIIVGQMYKIVPFLVWFNKYSDKVGQATVPMLKEMFDEQLAKIELGLMLAGFLIAAVALPLANTLLFRIGAIVLMASAAIFVWNMITIFKT
ncbi:MAG: hypothetical protein ONB44_21935 [candidate division KSB1 bacterium]|nr:hypothetical protein [candidate division KSB1 bacterium]MDZ7304798.1 hypothetical protein [candidate division KSB1 bacterium]MDZ7313856.1 hypothetical protein [candidate division KSB1 bacterium]